MQVCISSPAYLPAAAAGGGGITRVQSNSALADAASTVDIVTLSNVTAGNLVVVTASKSGGIDHDFVAGDLTKTAGTSTIGTIALDRTDTLSYITNQEYSGIWSVPVTGTGSLTLTLALTGGGFYCLITICEYSGADVSGTRVDDSDGATGTTDDGAGPSMSSTGAGVFVAVGGWNGASDITLTEDAAFDLIAEEEQGTLHQIGSAIEQIVSGATSDAPSWVTSGDTSTWTWCVSGVVYKAA